MAVRNASNRVHHPVSACYHVVWGGGGQTVCFVCVLEVGGGGGYFPISEDVKTRARMANSNATAPNPEDNKRAGRGLVHGSAECIKQGPPPGESLP